MQDKDRRLMVIQLERLKFKLQNEVPLTPAESELILWIDDYMETKNEAHRR